MGENLHNNKKKGGSRMRIILLVIALQILMILLLIGAYQLYIGYQAKQYREAGTQDGAAGHKPDADKEPAKGEKDNLSPKELEAKAEQERLKKEENERQELIARADKLAQGYNYEAAEALIKSYQSKEGGYQVYTSLNSALERLEKEKATLVLYGGSFDSITEVNHIFFHSLIADTSKAFDNDGDSKGYNMYMTTISEFKKILQTLYEQGYVLIRMSDVAKKTTQKDGTTKYVANEIYLREGKKPLILSEDDVSYYKYMDGDGFASRIVIGKDGKPVCEMLQEDGSTVTGAFDMVPIVDEFVEEHPDFSYRGAKGLIALTGYEGILGYRTNDKTSPTYKEDRAAAKKVADVMKAEGWEFGSHSWGHRDMRQASLGLFERDTKRWLKEVEPLVGATDIYVFPFGIDIETNVGNYRSDKYKFLKENGFDIFLGVFKDPWMQIHKDYVRATRRPLDGQAMLQYPERLTDLFHASDIIDPKRPARDW